MKRARNKSTEIVGKDEPLRKISKDEPPKKISKKRLKSITQSPSNPQSMSLPSPVTSVSAPVVAKPSSIPRPLNSASKLGSLPMYGEHLPDGGYPSIPQLVEKSCGNLRHVMSKIKDLKSKGGSKAETDIEIYKQKGLVNFVTLKKLNRLSHMYCKDTREQTHEQKLGVDDLHLQLQNLMYEAMHLRKEITNCLEFKSQHEEIDLINEEELLTSVPADTIPNDEHQRMLKRLEWELQQRKLLAEQQGGLESDISREEMDMKTKEENLSNILPTLEGIRKATLPLQESLGIPLDKKREEQEMALLLPSSLYIFYMQAKAYSEVQDPSLVVSIAGDVGEARTFQSNQQENSDDESGDSDNEGGDKERRKKRRIREKSSSEKKISKAHPLAIVCTLTLKDLGSFQFTFSYLPHFNVVCASISSVGVSGMTDEHISTHLDRACLLHCLLSDSDTGRTSPNAIVSFHIRKHGKEVFSSAVRAYGFPYKWVQNACGITDDVELLDNTASQQQVEVSAENVVTVVNRLKMRFKAQIYLLAQVVSLSSDGCKMILGPEAESVVFSEASCKLTKWKQVPLVDVQSTIEQFVSGSIFNQQERVNKFYLGVLQYDKVVMKCLLCVGANYPNTPPTFAINIVEDSDVKQVQEIQIKNIEADVNVQYPKSLKEDDKYGKYLLCRQLHRLQSCFDMYTQYKKSPNRIQSSKIRGKGRLLVLADC